MLDRSMRLIFHRPDDPVPNPFKQQQQQQEPDTKNLQYRLIETESLDSDDMDTNSRKRKMESEDSNHEDDVSIKSEAPKSISSLEEDKLTYGLKYNYLNSLGIQPPLGQWVQVSNFRCDKYELKEVLELAGQVLICSMIPLRDNCAKVMYSHPLEALQAVSMLNGQILNGQKLKVAVIACPRDTVILPKGLANVGPGLGVQGRPLRNIVKEYNKYLKSRNTMVDISLFRNADDKDDESQTDVITIKDEVCINSSQPDTCPSKVTHVEDLPDDESVSSESKSKKVKRDSEDNSIGSDQESEDGKLDKKSNASDEDSKQIDAVVVPRQDLRLDNDSNYNSSPNHNSGTDLTRHSMPPAIVPRPQSQPISMVFGSGPPQMRPRMGVCPPPPTIGPITQSGTMSPYAHTARPGHLNSSLVRPLVYPPGPMGPPLSCTVHSGRPLIPTAAHTGPAGAHTVRHPAPFSQVASSPFRPSVPNMANILPNPSLGPHSVVGGNVPVPEADQSIQLEFRNLPPTTTFQLLCEKVSQCGQLLSLQLTTPGCAIAKFPHRAHADRCFQFFHGKFIDGCVIEVRFL